MYLYLWALHSFTSSPPLSTQSHCNFIWKMRSLFFYGWQFKLNIKIIKDIIMRAPAFSHYLGKVFLPSWALQASSSPLGILSQSKRRENCRLANATGCLLLEQRTAWHLEQKSLASPATWQKWFLVLMGGTFSWIDPPFHRTNYRFINIYGPLVTADSSCLRTLGLISLPPGRGIWSQL